MTIRAVRAAQADAQQLPGDERAAAVVVHGLVSLAGLLGNAAPAAPCPAQRVDVVTLSGWCSGVPRYSAHSG